MNHLGILNSSPEQAIANQQARKKAVAAIIKWSPSRKPRPKAITKGAVRDAVRAALEDVARDLRFKAKETPSWAAAYHSACAVIEKRIPK